MPVTYEIDKARKLIRTSCRGNVTRVFRSIDEAETWLLEQQSVAVP